MSAPFFTLRDEAPGDVVAVRRLVGEAFRNAPHSSGSETAILDALRAGGAAVVSLVATGGTGEILGQVAFSPVEIGSGATGWHCLGPIAVRPGRQRQGVGAALVTTGLERLRALGSAGCVLVGDLAFYGRFGFRRVEGLRAPGIPDDYVLALPFGTGSPEGPITFDPAFSAVA